jgi:hypothetical protein
MSLDAHKTRIAGRIWQAIAQSDVNLSSIPRDQLELVVNTITDGVMLEFDAMLGEMDEPAKGSKPGNPDTSPAQKTGNPAPSGEEEIVLWEGRPFLSLRERYTVTNERVRIETGLIGRGHDDIEMIRLKDVDFTQGVSERMLNIGDIQLRSADPSRPNAVLRNVTDPAQVHEIIRRAMINIRKRYPTIFAQEM